MRERHKHYRDSVVEPRITPARAGKTFRLYNSYIRGEDHPRSCGKDGRVFRDALRVQGSPPLVRERLGSNLLQQVNTGITPARAGKTKAAIRKGAGDEDHPRSCGKDGSCYGFLRRVLGSPPLVRERRDMQPKCCNMMRITPARAGKTACHHPSGTLKRDHPRSCGKDTASNVLNKQKQGSPPLVRERRLSCSIVVIMIGITPARAGKTFRFRFPPYGLRDHPRSCGKDIISQDFWKARKGSPPLVRERPGLTQAEITKVRITPARAGKTTLSGYEYAYAQDHPRSCGKDHVLLWVLVLVSGSPPLVRERPLGGFGVRAGARITPARAGKTIPCRPKSWPAQDHPRSCGKDLKDDFQTKCGKGSPPLVRERLALGDVDVVFVGITPARAGKTPC